MAASRLDSEMTERIRAAVAEAEARSGGEIVPVFLPASDDYEVALWKGAALGGLLADALVAVWMATGSVWQVGPAWLIGWGGAGALAGALAALALPPLRRALAGGELLRRRVEQRASESFVAHEVFRTRERTGILILVSRFERRVAVLADEGIRSCVPHATWQALAAEIAARVRREGAGPALLAAVQSAGELLAAQGPPRRADDRNELPDRPRSEG